MNNLSGAAGLSESTEPEPRALRGARYIPKCRPRVVETIRVVRDFSFEGACEFYYTEVPNYSKAEVALLGCNDRFFLLTELLNRPDMIHPWLYERTRMVEEAPDGYLDLWARYHGKSSIITFAGVISEILHDPEITIAIFSATSGLALPFVEQIQQELESNERLKFIYDDVLWADPRRQANRWSKDRGITVRRQGNPKEPTVSGYGVVNAMPTGAHFGLMVFDDLVTQELVENPEVVKKVTLRWELADNLGTREGSRKWHAGTTYSHADTYVELLEDGRLIPRVYAATDDGTEDGNPVLVTPARLAQIMKAQPSTFGAQMLLNPSSSKDAMFRANELRSYVLRPRTLNVYIIVDPSMGRTATSDRTAMAVIGVDAGKNFYLLDGYCHRMRLQERWEKLKQLYLRWSKAEGVQFCKVGYERYGKDADIESFMWRMQEKGEPSFPIEELNYPREGEGSKKARVQRLTATFANGKFFLPAKVWHPRVKVAPDSNEYAARTCLWSVSDTGKIEYRALKLTKAGTPIDIGTEAQAKKNGEKYRLIPALRRLDGETGDKVRGVYDVTRILIDEYLKFPAPQAHDDLIDAVSRLYDIGIAAPVLINESLLNTPEYLD